MSDVTVNIEEPNFDTDISSGERYAVLLIDGDCVGVKVFMLIDELDMLLARLTVLRQDLLGHVDAARYAGDL